MTTMMENQVGTTYRLKRFMAHLDKIDPAEGREPQNYERSLGLFLVRAGLDPEAAKPHVYQDLALWPAFYCSDFLTPYDVEKLAQALGDASIWEFFHVLHPVLSSSSPLPYRQGDPPLSRLERLARTSRWLRASQEARLALVQELYELASGGGTPAWPLLLELVDRETLEAIAVY